MGFETGYTLDLEGTSAANARYPDKEGAYKIKIVSFAEYDSKDDVARVVLHGMVVDGEFKGCMVQDGNNVPDPEDADRMKKLAPFWKAIYLSTGRTWAQVDKKFTTKWSHFQNKIAYVYYIPKSEENQYSDLTWITEEQYTSFNETAVAVASDDIEIEDDEETETPPPKPKRGRKTAAKKKAEPEPEPADVEEDDDDDDGEDPLDAIDDM